MKPAPFEYAAPDSVGEVIRLLSTSGEDDVRILAGGQSLMPMIHMRLARPQLLIDLGHVKELDYIRESDDGHVAIGSMTTKRAVERSELIKERQPLFHQATVLIGHPQIRNRGTVGGSMAQADPAAEYPAAALALGMEMVAQGPDGERVVEADDFFITYLTTALEPGELLTEVRIPPMAPGTGWSFQEIARRHGDFAMVGALATLRVEGGVCADTRIVTFGVADRANRMTEAEALVDGQPPEAATFERAAAKAADEIEDPMSDVHASSEYRRDMARVLTQRALVEAHGRAG
jgi:carbon-monoxide dehydrogenase medium subunit